MIPDNVFALILLGLAFWKSGYKFFIMMLIVQYVSFSGFDWAATNELYPYDSKILYYWFMSMFFIVWFGIWIMNNTKLTIWLAGLCLIQASLAMLMAINGETFNEMVFQEYEIIYTIHERFNDLVWVVECIIAWIAATGGERYEKRS